MFVCSAPNNMMRRPASKDLLRRIDQSAIYVKIAGSYTPFAVLAGTHAGLFLAGLWGAALAGRLAYASARRRLKWVASCSTCSSAGLAALFGGPMIEGLTPTGFRSSWSAGIIYTFGVGLLRLGAAALPQHHLARLRRSAAASSSTPRCWWSFPAAPAREAGARQRPGRRIPSIVAGGPGSAANSLARLPPNP